MTAEKAKSVADALAARFTAHVDIEEISPGRYRFEVYSKHFGDAGYILRQDQAWEVIDRLLSRDEALDISLLLTIGPEDVDESLVAMMP